MKKMMVAVLGCSSLVMGTFAAPDFTALETEIGTSATAVAGVAAAAIIAGFGIFVLIWGARKIKGALSSGG